MAETTGSPVAVRLAFGAARERAAGPLAAVFLGVTWLAGTLALGGTVTAGLDRLHPPGPERGGSLALLRGVPGIFGTVALVAAGAGVHGAFARTHARRAREYARLRALGATRGQVLGIAAAEALAVGAAGTLAGLAAGIGCAALLAPSGTGPPIAGDAALLAVPAGLGGTLLAALPPAVRAVRVPPAVAPREGGPAPPVPRVLVWIVLAAVAAGAVLTGALIGSASMAGVGAAMAVAVTAPLAPLAARHAANLAGEDTAREPRRTARAGCAVMAGAGAVASLAVLAGAARASAARLPPGAGALRGAVDGMLALAIAVVVLGMAGTLALSARERAREPGAAGSRARVNARWEALITVLYGTAAGTGLGLFLGWALVRARDAPVTAPPFRIGLIVIAVAAAGIAAATRAAARRPPPTP
ncbi:FtsX-like permease family protein [Spirillospora sp. NPDC029432]|uniref:FtsX-like permease family protein n=1 Tax=Spirillospora sp. NPDC029432 TaxID=3154599 RepID=UPI003454A85F